MILDPARMTKMSISTITTRGRVTMPKEIRVALGAQPGDKILVEIVDLKKRQGTLTIIPRAT